MHVQIRVRRWVIWWLYVGVALGVIAIGNILARDLTHRQIRIALFVGVVHWVLGGLICYVLDAVRIEQKAPPPRAKEVGGIAPEKEWHSASDFLLPGGGKSVLPPRY